MIEKYQNASSDVKLQMELRYGKKQLETLVNNSMAESWIKNNSKACPHCGAAIEVKHFYFPLFKWLKLILKFFTEISGLQ